MDTCPCGGRWHYPCDSLTVEAGGVVITLPLYDEPYCDGCGKTIGEVMDDTSIDDIRQ